jgi:hypothetical protein
MPTLQTFTDFVDGLKGRAKARPFSLKIHGKFVPRETSLETEFVRLLRADYQPVTMGLSRSSVRPVDEESSIHYEVNPDGIHEVFASIISETGTLVTTTDLYIQVPVDREQREGFLRQHGLHWDEVDWNDEEAEIEEDWQSDDSEASHESSEEEGFEIECEEGEENEEGEHRDNAEAEEHSGQTSGHESSASDITQEEPPAAPHTIVRIRVPDGVNDHDAWLREHRLGRESAMWLDIVQADDEDEPLIGVGIEINTDVHRENARNFDPAQVTDFRERIALHRLAWINYVRDRNQGDLAH